MRSAWPGSWPLVAVLLLATSSRSSGQSTSSASAAGCWVEGEAEGALSALGAASRTRETALNRAVVQLYAGRATEAASALATLHDRERGWTPALRWLARAQEELGQPEALDSAAVLLASPGVAVLDQLWAGDLYLTHGRLPQARSAFQSAVRRNDGIDLAWRGLALVETRLGDTASAHEAGARASAFYGGGEGPAVVPASALRPGEVLRYQVKYLFLHLASLTLETGGLVRQGGEPAHRVVFSAKSNGGIPFFHIDSRFESVVGEDGAVLAHRHVASDSDSGADDAGYDMDRRSRRCTVRTVRDGVFGYQVLPLPANAQDGVSVLLVARALARVRGTAVVPTAVDSMWWPTHLRTLGVERVGWRGRDVRAVHMQAAASYRGPGGLSGVVDLWISDDERAVPYRVKMKVAVGSVVLELLPDEPPAARRASAGEAER